jgi:FkbM family methyltransferase
MDRLRLIKVLHYTRTYAAVNWIRDYAQALEARSRTSFAQHGEDEFLLDYFGERTGTYIDVGANHPFRLSNTYLLYRHGWRGVTIEPLRYLSAKHRRFRPHDVQVNAAAGEYASEAEFYEVIPHVGSTFDRAEAQRLFALGRALPYKAYRVPVVCVQDVYEQYLAPRALDLLSVDTEGWDLAVLRGVNWQILRPRLIIYEQNDSEHGSQTAAFLVRNGYQHVTTLGCNAIYEERGS